MQISILYFVGVAIGVSIGILVGYNRWHKQKPVPTGPQLKGARFMRSFPEDRPADIVTVKPGVVTDSEGGVLDPQPPFTIVVQSSDDSICSVLQDTADPSKFTLSYGTARKNADGSFASATVTATVTDTNAPAITETITEDIQLIVSNAAAISPGTFAFPGDAPASV